MTFTISPQRKQEYLKRRQAEVSLFLEKNFSEREIQQDLMRMLHQIKGNAKTFGFEDLGTMAEKIESEILSSAAFPPEEQIKEKLQKIKDKISYFWNFNNNA